MVLELLEVLLEVLEVLLEVLEMVLETPKIKKRVFKRFVSALLDTSSCWVKAMVLEQVSDRFQVGFKDQRASSR